MCRIEYNLKREQLTYAYCRLAGISAVSGAAGGFVLHVEVVARRCGPEDASLQVVLHHTYGDVQQSLHVPHTHYKVHEVH